MDKLRSLREMQPLSDRHKIAQVVQIQFLIPPDLSILFELLTIDEFDHLAVTAGESLDLGEVARVDLGKARRFFDVRFWGAVTAAKYAAKRNQIDRIGYPDKRDHRFASAKRMGHRCRRLRCGRSGHPRASNRTGSGKSKSRLCWDSP